MTEKAFEKEVKAGERFEFGRNWFKFLSLLDDARIQEAENSLLEMLETDSLNGHSFLDVGSGSGLFSLAAIRLGASRVFSIDYDPQSVACAAELKKRYVNDSPWVIERGSVLDEDCIQKLGQYDIVYSWGVLHHTGSMWQALENVSRLVAPNGKLFISVYNDQGRQSVWWKRLKIIYNSNWLGRFSVICTCIPAFILIACVLDLARLRNPLSRYRNYKKCRGMSLYHDLCDWLGGLPFEVAKPEAIFDFYRKKNFVLTRLITRQGIGCNEYVFKKVSG